MTKLDRDELAARATAARAALLALCDALRPEAVAPAPSRPEWVRWKASELFPDVPRRVLRWVDGCPVVGRMSTRNSNDGPDESLESEPIPSGGWEPCAAPSPAASPAPYVPRVDDVVRDKDHSEYAEILVVSVGDGAFDGRVMSHNGPSWQCTRPSAMYAFVRRATSSERAAAGLPVDESAFDEAKEREAARVAVSRDAGDDFTRGWLARARVAAKGGA